MKTLDKDSKVLVIVESPHKTKGVTAIFKSLGFKNVRVVASVGHITKIKDTRGSFKNTGIYPDKNFKVNYCVEESKHKKVEELKLQAAWADVILLATDPDREGEDIAWHIKNQCKIKDSDYFRIMYQSITKSAIEKSLEKLTKIDMNLVDSAEARKILDKIIGYVFSPLLKKYVGGKSGGRVQSVVLRLITDREAEIRNFISESYFDLYLSFFKNAVEFAAKYVGTDLKPIKRLSGQDEVNEVIVKCTGDFIVKNISKKIRQESPKPPFSTDTFLQAAANRLGLSVQVATDCIQKLYDGVDINGEHFGIVTYIRTDSTFISEDFIPELKNYIESTYGKGTFVQPRQGAKSETAQEGHEALRITDPTLTPDKLALYLNNDLLVKVYKLIWERTIASAMPNAEIEEVTYDIYNNDQKFVLVSNELVKPGYRDLYCEDSLENAPVKESFTKGEKLENTSLNPVAKATKPKPRYKEASLIKEMKAQEIGRPSTYKSTVVTELDPSRGYCELIEKEITPTDRGIQVVNYLVKTFEDIMQYEYTKQMEKSLDDIATGKLNKLDFLNSFMDTLNESLERAKQFLPEEEEACDKICPLCGAPMAIKRSRFGKLFYGCTNYPKCRGIVNKD